MSAQILTCVIMIFWQCTTEYHDLLSIHWPPCTSHIKYLYEDVILQWLNKSKATCVHLSTPMYIIRTPPSLNFIVRLLKFRVPGNNSIILVTTFWFFLCVCDLYTSSPDKFIPTLTEQLKAGAKKANEWSTNVTIILRNFLLSLHVSSDQFSLCID